MKLSVVSAVWNAEKYLPRLFESIDQQDINPEDIEFIFVIDGSPDDSQKVIETWAATTKFKTTVLTKTNGGQASARNLGLERATGDWIAFTDPDDFWNDVYLAEVCKAISEHGNDIDIVATRPVLFYEKDNSFTYDHPRRRSWDFGTRISDLNEDSDSFPVGAPMNFYRRGVIERHKLRFREEIRPQFEDGYFTCEYLLLNTTQRVYFLDRAEYYYRKRNDGSSTLSSTQNDKNRMLLVPEVGYLPILRQAASLYGEVPYWLQSVIVYELSMYTMPQERLGRPNIDFTEAERENFLSLLKEIRTYLSTGLIETCRARKISYPSLMTLAYGLLGKPWVSEVQEVLYRGNRGRRFFYYFIGEQPKEVFTLNGRAIQLNGEHNSTVDYYGIAFMQRRDIWLPAHGALSIRLNGKHDKLEPSPELTIQGFLLAIFRYLFRIPLRLEANKAVVARQTIGRGLAILSLYVAGDPSVAARFKSRQIAARLKSKYKILSRRPIWVFIDRFDIAADSAEELFRYVAEKHPEIDARYIVSKHSPDFKRLRRAGFGRKILAYESNRWLRVTGKAQVWASSHLSWDVDPKRQARMRGVPHLLAKMTYRTIFLQHGVIKDDLATYINSKNFDLMIVSTKPESDSILDSRSRYQVGEHQLALTGLPRFDSLTRAKTKSGGDSKYIIIAPTWRYWLDGGDGTEIMKFFTAWQSAINSLELQKFAEENNLTICLLAHPNLQLQGVGPFTSERGLKKISYDMADIHSYFAEAAVLITDYSSVAFNAAFLKTPTVYYQFDWEKFSSGGHTSEPGYFEYERDGFGPVTRNLEEFTQVFARMTQSKLESLASYKQRMEIFVSTDGRASERTFEAILQVIPDHEPRFVRTRSQEGYRAAQQQLEDTIEAADDEKTSGHE